MVRYFIKLVSVDSHLPTILHASTFKKLKNLVKELLEKKSNSFVVYANFSSVRWCKKMDIPLNNSFFEFWEYEVETDMVYRYNLRRNVYYKRLKHMERKLSPIMLKHAVKKI